MTAPLVRFDPASIALIGSKFAEIGKSILPEVSRLALNDMAFEVHAENKNLMRRVFENPTPFTLNAFWVRKATLDDLTATVERKTLARGRHYLEVQSEGGQRGNTGYERKLKSRLKYEGLIHAVVPTKALRRNRYGNVSAGMMNRILSSVQAQDDRAANTTARSRARAGARRAEYFVPKVDSSLSAGIWERRGRKIRKVLAFSQAVPSYQERYPMEKHAAKIAGKKAPDAVERALARALSRL